MVVKLPEEIMVPTTPAITTMVQDQEKDQAHSQRLICPITSCITTALPIHINQEVNICILIVPNVVTTTTQTTILPIKSHTTTCTMVCTDSKQIVRSFLKFKQINNFLNISNIHSIFL